MSISVEGLSARVLKLGLPGCFVKRVCTETLLFCYKVLKILGNFVGRG